MGTINYIKQLAEPNTPLLFFECAMPSGVVEYWSTHSIAFQGNQYSARVLKHNLFDLQLSADDAMDGITQLSLVLANADSWLSELNNPLEDNNLGGFKGSQLTVYFAFVDLPSGTVETENETMVLFRGIAGDPDEIAEDTMTLSFTNKLSLQRIPVPEVRIQRSCPWNFPSTLEQRTQALSGPRYSPYFRCGYSADVAGGIGNLNNGQAYTSCDKSRTSCVARGMFSSDNAGHLTRSFGGFEFVPSAIMVRTAGDKTSHVSPLLDDPAKYNDPVPIIYGQGWLKAPVIFSRNDGNLTHMEVLLGMGSLQNNQSIFKVVVNDVEIPIAVQNTNMTTTGWYNVVTLGNRQGNFNLDFADSNGNPLGDPYGSMSVLSVVVPNRISSGRSLPNVQVLVQGIALDIYNLDGSFQQTTYSNNPAWVILDILQRCGWSTADLNLSTFANAAQFCGTLISTTDINGNPLPPTPRYKCNLILTKRQSAATVIRGIRVAASLMLRYGLSGQLELVPETTVEGQQPNPVDGGNSTQVLDTGGWPAYEFSDATGPFSGIVRNPNGTSTLRLTARTIAETSNRVSVEFQDENNEYQQDSLSIVNSNDSALIGYEISSQSTALGIANFSQATRVLLQQLDKLIEGNLYVEFQTSFRALKIRPGDIIALTYQKENFVRIPFRVVKLSPSVNYQQVTVLAQIHDDDWYSDNPAVLAAAGRQPASQVQTPRPLIGVIAHNDASGNLEYFDFKVSEQIASQSDGSATDTLTVSFSQPNKPTPNSPSLPAFLSLSPEYPATSGATLQPGASYYYAVTALDSAFNEGSLSFTVSATVPAGANSVQFDSLSFPSGAAYFNVYRGSTPQMLYQIASRQAISTTQTSQTFLDTGFAPLPIGPPDASFDHANFYYRFEYTPAYYATTWNGSMIGCDDFGGTNSAYVGMAVRIVDGTGRGQERLISANDATTLTVTSPWAILPDITSQFVVAEPSWRFAAISSSVPTSTPSGQAPSASTVPEMSVQFEIPYRNGNFIEISGRGANVNNQEGTADLCPVTRWALGQQAPDGGVPEAPIFYLAVQGVEGMTVAGGDLALYRIGFTDLTNTESISSGTLQVFYWAELDTPSTFTLASPVATTDGLLVLTSLPVSLPPEQSSGFIQVDQEIMAIVTSDPDTNAYIIQRAVLGSSVAAHQAGAVVYHLGTSVVIAPFAPNFFANRASSNYVHTVSMPDMRICAAEFYVTNSFGDSQTQTNCYTSNPDGGLRTLSGGQFSLQVSGYLATQQNAAPPLLVETSHAVRDVRATVNQAPAGYSISVDILQNGTFLCNVTIPDQQTSSPVIDGVTLPAPLIEGEQITINVTLQVDPNPPSSVTSGSTSPGRDLTVTIRL